MRAMPEVDSGGRAWKSEDTDKLAKLMIRWRLLPELPRHQQLREFRFLGFDSRRLHHSLAHPDPMCDVMQPSSNATFDHQSHTDRKPRQDVDQCIGAEQVDATAQKVAHAGCVTRSTFAASASLNPLMQ
jgi:hypothetical protein